MAEELAYVPAAASLSLGWYELRPARRGTAVGCLCGFWLCMGAAMALLAPGTAAVLRVLSVPAGCVHLLGRELEMAALSFLPLAAMRLGLPRWRAVSECSHAFVGVTAGTLCAVLFLAASAGGRPPAGAAGGVAIVAGGRADWAALAAFDTVFTLYSLWCLVLFALPVRRCARGLRPGALRTGLRLVAAGTAVGALWAVWGVSGIVNMAVDHRQGAEMDPVAMALASGCLLLAALGATAALWHPLVAGGRHRLRAWRAHRALEPLWAALHAVVPETALTVPGPRAVPLAPGGARFALYRRVIEIRDGYLALRPYWPAQTPSWTAAALARFPVDPGRRPVVEEAAWLVAALEAARAGRRCAPGRAGEGPGARGESPALGADDGTFAAGPGTVEEEAAWLVAVAEAFTGDRAVAYTRRLARHAGG
ncbi:MULTISPECIES: MAB_1171c family putative transporter [unclassified Streptomyces]|uniref:MAB_1171c family putative transporter n=1 Tax=unclassified Streptomyces TaxID=2593676 RepID=UPI0004C1C69D|nr:MULTISPECIES: MAB_1171c family putative transporter [unclassified Streptomyces]